MEYLFVQEEDGIRGLLGSRGCGEVDKGQVRSPHSSFVFVLMKGARCGWGGGTPIVCEAGGAQCDRVSRRTVKNQGGGGGSCTVFSFTVRSSITHTKLSSITS